MRVMDVLRRIKDGATVMVTLPGERSAHNATRVQYTLTDGTEVPPEQFEKIRDFLTPADPPLIEGCEPGSYKWDTGTC